MTDTTIYDAGFCAWAGTSRVRGTLVAELPCNSSDTIFVGECYTGIFTYINGGTVRNASIGRYCSIGQDVLICPGNHPTDIVSTHPFAYQPDGPGAGTHHRPEYLAITAAPERETDEREGRVTIGNDVWIGARVTILAGVTVGDGAVIAAHSVVTRDVAPYTIVAGVPARFLRQRLPDIYERLHATRWWDYDLSTLPEKEYSQVERFIQRFEAAKPPKIRPNVMTIKAGEMTSLETYTSLSAD